jgi:hypothetical protein
MKAASPLLACIVAFSASAALAQPRISNRDAKPDEWGYRPVDGSSVLLNPPSLTWVHEAAAVSYSVEWSTNEEMKNPTVVENVVWPTYTHHSVLPAATYFWRYRYTDQKGQTSSPSQIRRFTIPAEAQAFPMPTRAEQRSRVPASHPRLFMRPEDLPRLRALAIGRDAKLFDKLREEADRLIKAGPTPEPTEMGSARDKENAEMVKYWWPNRVQTDKACKEAETIAFVYLMTGDQKYGAAARKWIMHLASWDPDGPTNFKLNCEAGKPMLFRPARAYDWAYDTLSEADREIFRAVMQRRVKDAWESNEVQRGVGHLSRPYGSHGNRVWHKLGETGIALLGEVPEAETWLDYAVNKFYSCYPVWSDDDGAWHEGVSYWGGYMSKAVWWMQVAQSALEIDGYQKPFFSQVADYPLYVAPPGSPNMGFGDLSYRSVPKSWGGFLEYHLRAGGRRPEATNAAYWRWWTEQWKMQGEAGWMGFLYAANLPAMPEAKPPVDLPLSKVFHGVGVASLHTTLLSAADDVHLLFKSSPFGSQSHGHNPQNSFQLNAYGEALLTTCVYRDLHGSKFHYQWAHSTVAHNAVLVNGKGQTKHTAAVKGKIIAEQLTPGHDYVVGDAPEAYAGRLSRALRHVVFVRGKSPLIVLFDELEAVEPSTFQFMLHGLAPFAVDDARNELRQEQPQAGCVARYLSPAKLTFRQWDGYDPKPSSRQDFQNQWHVEAGTVERQKSLGMFTLIVPYRAGAVPTIAAERSDSDGAVGLTVTVDGRVHSIALRRAGVEGPASWNGKPLTGSVLVSQP